MMKLYRHLLRAMRPRPAHRMPNPLARLTPQEWAEIARPRARTERD